MPGRSIATTPILVVTPVFSASLRSVLVAIVRGNTWLTGASYATGEGGSVTVTATTLTTCLPQTATAGVVTTLCSKTNKPSSTSTSRRPVGLYYFSSCAYDSSSADQAPERCDQALCCEWFDQVLSSARRFRVRSTTSFSWSIAGGGRKTEESGEGRPAVLGPVYRDAEAKGTVTGERRSSCPGDSSQKSLWGQRKEK